MYSLPANDAFRLVIERKDRFYHFPSKQDGRYRNGGLFPHLDPKFQLSTENRVFTMGSCFARHIEDTLAKHGFQLPLKSFAVPEGEIPYPAPHLLNEYNAGTISQRLRSVMGQYTFHEDAGIEEGESGESGESGAIDLFLHIASRPVALDRLKARRLEIMSLYETLKNCDCLVLTLGLVESWYDLEFQCYLNRAPSFKKIRKQPGRYEFRRFDVEDVVAQLKPVIHSLLDENLEKVLLTVSPVPMEASFMPGDIVVNNAYSKSTLRVVCELLSRNEPCIDYFPSYEIVSSYGIEQGFIEDGVHPRASVVDQVIAHMAQHYLPWRILTIPELKSLFDAWAVKRLRVVLYPAGSQAQDMLQQTPNLRKTLVGFGDKNPVKQADGLLGYPVLSPATITADKVDLVLIVSRLYESEISADLASLANQGIQVIKFRDLCHLEKLPG